VSATGKRLLWVGLGTLVVCVLLGLYVGLYLVNVPGSAAAVQTASGTQLYLATVPAAALDDPHPTWVSYYAVNANDGNWRHVTTYTLPAHSTVHITIYNWDSQTGLRNPFLAQSQGVASFALDGKPGQTLDPDAASHIFAIPQLGVSVPVQGVADDAKNPCSNAPCTLKEDHTTTTFTIHTRDRGYFRWQCFVPCAAGFIGGTGGPMSMVGYMDGFIKVV
jgi:hypothetical protein